MVFPTVSQKSTSQYHIHKWRERLARLGWKLRLWPWISPVEQHVFFLPMSRIGCKLLRKKCAALDQQEGLPFNLDQGVDSRSREAAGWLVVAPKYHQLPIYKSCHRESFAVNGHWVKSVLFSFCYFFFRVPSGSSLGLDLCWWHNRFFRSLCFKRIVFMGSFCSFTLRCRTCWVSLGASGPSLSVLSIREVVIGSCCMFCMWFIQLFGIKTYGH